MAYSTGLMRYVVAIYNRTAASAGSFGFDTEQSYAKVDDFWASVTFTKGVKAMREGALDAYDTIMIRMRYTPDVNRNSLVQFNGRFYEIESFHEDFQENIIQITARERADQSVTITPPTPPTPDPTPDPEPEPEPSEEQ